jgi:transcriptional regulator with XRE-family HTH domain
MAGGSFGSRVAGQRRVLEMTQEEFAKQAKISVSMLSKVERNEAIPSLTTASKIAKTLGVGLGYLMDGER